MSSKKEDAADRIKAAALSAAKGLSRAQAERAAAAASRNVNAYGQKEEGPSRWQEKREAKRQMYLMSTEKQVRLGERKDLKSTMFSAGGSAQCQKCFQSGHWTFECKNERVYMARPSRTQQLKNPKLRMMLSMTPSHMIWIIQILRRRRVNPPRKARESIDRILILEAVVRLQFLRVIVGHHLLQKQNLPKKVQITAHLLIQRKRGDDRGRKNRRRRGEEGGTPQVQSHLTLNQAQNPTLLIEVAVEERGTAEDAK